MTVGRNCEQHSMPPVGVISGDQLLRIADFGGLIGGLCDVGDVWNRNLGNDRNHSEYRRYLYQAESSLGILISSRVKSRDSLGQKALILGRCKSIDF